ncbi:MAG: single-stranded-DNA-specific exonuclease RecJ [Clostridia bacterium]|nr:single-stranded-DNA-specific exonuclease RecJ [Clostridia bacterium]
MDNEKLWRRRETKVDADAVRVLSADLGLMPLMAELLISRGYTTSDAAREFLSLSAHYHDPFLLPDMQAAAERVSRAIDGREQIAVYGDYDVDGVTSTATLMLWLRSMGLSPISYIPDRESEGYGLSIAALDRLKEQGVTLIITVDNGVTAIEEASHCKAIGIDLVITDHHECQEALPEAIAVVDPKRPDSTYPFSGLAGVGVALKLVSAVELFRHPGEDPNLVLRSVFRRYIDLAAIGTVADVMPLVDENRFIVSRGLQMIEKRPRPAITALLNAVADEKGSAFSAVNTTLISFTLAPRINAAGRMESADVALKLFLCDPADAPEAANYLCDCNRRRREEEERIFSLSERALQSSPPLHSIVLGGEDFCGGVVGIVAAKLCERYDKPAILLSFDGEIGKGSGRAPEGVNLVGALEATSHLLIRYGGHTAAAGLTIHRDNLSAFAEAFDAAVSTATREVPVREYDLALTPSQMTVRLARELTLLEPCGASNPLPLFCWEGAEVESILPLGEKHTKLICRGEGVSHPVLLFGTPRNLLDIFPGDRIDLLFELSLNEFRNQTTLQLICRGHRPAAGEMKIPTSHYDRVSALLAGDLSVLTEADLPTREDCGRVYRILRGRLGYGRSDLISPRHLMEGAEDYLKLRLTLALLSDAGLLTVRGNGPLTIALPKTDQKVDLTALPLWKKLHSLF